MLLYGDKGRSPLSGENGFQHGTTMLPKAYLPVFCFHRWWGGVYSTGLEQVKARDATKHPRRTRKVKSIVLSMINPDLGECISTHYLLLIKISDLVKLRFLSSRGANYFCQMRK